MTHLAPSWYHPIGETAYFTLTDTQMTIHTGRETDGRLKVSGHLRISRHSRYTNRFDLHATSHSPGLKNIEVPLTGDDMRMMFDCKRDADRGNQIDYALAFRATLARQGFFIRHLHMVNFPCPGTGLDGDPNFSFRLKPEMTKVVEKLIETGKTR